MMKTLVSIHNSLLARVILLVIVCISVSLITQNHLNAEETATATEKIELSTISWGRKYFFDAPRFKEDNVQELLDSAIQEKLKTYGIQILEGNNKNKYVLNYTLVLEEDASTLEVEELLNQEPEIKTDSDEGLIVEKGIFTISIRDRDSRMAIWKNNLEGVASLEMSDDVRQKRIHEMIEQVFMTFPSQFNYSQ